MPRALQALKEDMRATEAKLREAAGERAQLLSQADEVKRQYLVAQDNVEEEQSVVMRMRVRVYNFSELLVYNLSELFYLTSDKQSQKIVNSSA